MESSFVQTKQKPGEINVLFLQEFNCLQQNGITVLNTVNHILSLFFLQIFFQHHTFKRAFFHFLYQKLVILIPKFYFLS